MSSVQWIEEGQLVMGMSEMRKLHQNSFSHFIYQAVLHKCRTIPLIQITYYVNFLWHCSPLLTNWNLYFPWLFQKSPITDKLHTPQMSLMRKIISVICSSIDEWPFTDRKRYCRSKGYNRVLDFHSLAVKEEKQKPNWPTLFA